MADIMETNADSSPIVIPLKMLFHLGGCEFHTRHIVACTETDLNNCLFCQNR